VGAESQIISPELYGKATQDKFAAAITELDENGNAYVPTFYKGRIYFNFSSDEQFETQYEELLRWILGQPQKVKPELGSTPRHIEDVGYSIATESKFQRALNALKESSSNATGLLKEFADVLVKDFEKLRLSGINKPEFDDEIVQSIEFARPYVEQMIGLSTAIARYSRDDQAVEEFIRIMERLGKFMSPPQSGSFTEWDCDNYRYLCHEMFLTSFAISLREERFDLAQKIVAHAYFIETDRQRDRATQSYEVFRPYVVSLRGRNERLKLNRLSLHADLLERSYKDRVPSFTDLLQADFVLYLRDTMSAIKNEGSRNWYPVTLLYAGRRFRPFDVFARSESKKYFEKVASVLDAGSVGQFKSFIGDLEKSDRVPHFDYQRLAVTALSNAANIGLVP
jgi:hypothetical protein